MFKHLQEKYTSAIYYLYVAITYFIGMALLWVLTALDEKAHELTPVKVETVCGTLHHGNGLIETLYDENEDGTPDRFTLTGITRSGEPRNNALFYGEDRNQDGVWERVWIDRAEDGINGNEILYAEEKE